MHDGIKRYATACRVTFPYCFERALQLTRMKICALLLFVAAVQGVAIKRDEGYRKADIPQKIQTRPNYKTSKSVIERELYQGSPIKNLRNVETTQIDQIYKPSIGSFKVDPQTFSRKRESLKLNPFESNIAVRERMQFPDIKPYIPMENSICQFRNGFNKDMLKHFDVNDLMKFPGTDFFVEWVYTTDFNKIPVYMETDPTFTDITKYNIDDLLMNLDQYKEILQDPTTLALAYTRRVLLEVFYKRMQCRSSILDRTLLNIVKSDLDKILPIKDCELLNYLTGKLSEAMPMDPETNKLAYWTTTTVHDTFRKDILNFIIATTYPDLAKLSHTLFDNLVEFFEELWMPNTERTTQELSEIIARTISECDVSCPNKQTFLTRHELAYKEVDRFYTEELNKLAQKINYIPSTWKREHYDCPCKEIQGNCPCNMFQSRFQRFRMLPRDVERMVDQYIYRPVQIVAEYEKWIVQNNIPMVLEKFRNLVDPVDFDVLDKAYQRLQWEL